MRYFFALVLLSCGTPGGSAGTTGGTCTAKWSGASSGTLDCGKSPIVLGVQTASQLGWLAVGNNDQNAISFDVALANAAPTLTTYTGGAGLPNCRASVQNTTPLKIWTASSAGAMPKGTCSITFTSVVDQSSKSSAKYEVHGTATASLVQPDNTTVTLDITF